MATMFLSEFLTSGAWPRQQPIPESLVNEGRAMLESVLHDLLNLPDLHVRLTWDHRLPPPKVLAASAEGIAGLESVVTVLPHLTLLASDSDSQPTLRRDCCSRVDHILLIAPEFNDILGEFLDEASTHPQACLWNTTPTAARLCADKFRLAENLQQYKVPVIPTRRVSEELPDDWTELIIKPRDGAGSQGIRRFTRDAFLHWKERLRGDDRGNSSMIVQPSIRGQALSAAAIFGSDGTLHDIWPVAEQHLDPETFSYLGGEIPARNVNRAAIETIISSVANCLTGLRGYVGFDLIQRPDGEVVLVEINPRLTTSYVGYRALAGAPLAGWLQPQTLHQPAPRWRPHTVRFSATGQFTTTPEMAGTPY